jgi:hypothetical protein
MAVTFLIQSLASEPELPPQSTKRREVVEFMLARIHKASKWVRFYVNMRCTHGIKASQRVEVDFSAIARIGINARLSWETSSRRLMIIQSRRHRNRMKWISEQLTGELFRDVTNKESSTLTRADLLNLDKFILQWALDCFEEQLLLAANSAIRVIYMTSSAFAFCVHYDDDVDRDEDADVRSAALLVGSESYMPTVTPKSESDESSC